MQSWLPICSSSSLRNPCHSDRACGRHQTDLLRAITVRTVCPMRSGVAYAARLAIIAGHPSLPIVKTMHMAVSVAYPVMKSAFVVHTQLNLREADLSSLRAIAELFATRVTQLVQDELHSFQRRLATARILSLWESTSEPRAAILRMKVCATSSAVSMR